MMRPTVGTTQIQQHRSRGEAGQDGDAFHHLERRLRTTLGVPPADELRLPPEHPRIAQLHWCRQRSNLRHERRQRSLVVFAQLEPPRHHVLDSPLACNSSRSLRLARNSSTLMHFPRPSEAAIPHNYRLPRTPATAARDRARSAWRISARHPHSADGETASEAERGTSSAGRFASSSAIDRRRDFSPRDKGSAGAARRRRCPGRRATAGGTPPARCGRHPRRCR